MQRDYNAVLAGTNALNKLLTKRRVCDARKCQCDFKKARMTAEVPRVRYKVQPVTLLSKDTSDVFLVDR